MSYPPFSCFWILLASGQTSQFLFYSPSLTVFFPLLSGSLHPPNQNKSSIELIYNKINNTKTQMQSPGLIKELPSSY